LIKSYSEAARQIIGAERARIAILADDGKSIRHFGTSGLHANLQTGLGPGAVALRHLDRLRADDQSTSVSSLRHHALREHEPPDRPEREPRRRENREDQLPRSVSTFHR
jgi:hypothetical protein